MARRHNFLSAALAIYIHARILPRFVAVILGVRYGAPSVVVATARKKNLNNPSWKMMLTKEGPLASDKLERYTRVGILT
jgi:hypothetical protein